MRLGIALEGGAERCAFTAGILDELMRIGVPVSAITGTSAGAGCAMNFCAGQPGIALDMMILPKSERYFGIRHLIQKRQFLNLSYMAKRYADCLDFDAFLRAPIHTDFTATNCADGSAVYLEDHGDKKRLLETLMATCALPIICPPIELDGNFYVDGSIADPIPFAHLLENGCDKVLVILTGGTDSRPTDYRKLKPILWKTYSKTYPILYQTILHRMEIYRSEAEQMWLAQQLGQVFVMRPQIAPISLFTQNVEQITRYYMHGKAYFQKRWVEIERWLSAAPVMADHPQAMKSMQMQCAF